MVNGVTMEALRVRIKWLEGLFDPIDSEAVQSIPKKLDTFSEVYIILKGLLQQPVLRVSTEDLWVKDRFGVD